MLVKCPECDLQVSDKAFTCPHCGYPLKKGSKSKYQSTKRRRLPNGFGQISEIKNKNLREPFRAMVSIGKDENGRPITKLLKPKSYFKTYNDAYAALVKYNTDPSFVKSTLSFQNLYDLWFADYSKEGLTDTLLRSTKNTWKLCEKYVDLPVSQIHTRELKNIIDDVDHNPGSKKAIASRKARLKSLLNLMFDYALTYEYTDRNYARAFSLTKDVIKDLTENTKHHMCYTDEEINILWNNLNFSPIVAIILVQCYSGWRPNELCSLEVENINLDNETYTGGSKTKSGMNRVVPIHSKVRDIVLRLYEEAKEKGRKYLFVNFNGTPYSYRLFNYDYRSMVSGLHLNEDHRCHDGRKHFITAAKKYDVNEYAIKYMVGHKINDITEKIYTDRELAWLHEEIEKIK